MVRDVRNQYAPESKCWNTDELLAYVENHLGLEIILDDKMTWGFNLDMPDEEAVMFLMKWNYNR